MKQDTLKVADFRQTEICPDCIARDDVDLLGRPRRGRHSRIRICLGCKGSARVARQKVDLVAWWVSKRDEL